MAFIDIKRNDQPKEFKLPNDAIIKKEIINKTKRGICDTIFNRLINDLGFEREQYSIRLGDIYVIFLTTKIRIENKESDESVIIDITTIDETLFNIKLSLLEDI